ncbi:MULTISPECIES: EpsG family protein [Thomasclavelia]|uniref:EpsG family protein n=1 Tax=Thomasclavelia TaxID=3025755 RepID=UPI003208E5C0
MSLYICLIVFLLVTGIITELSKKKFKSILFKINALLMGIMLIFRFGQGSDYFSYMYIYSVLGKSNSLNQAINYPIHSEKLWKAINYIFAKMGVSYEIFILILSIFLFASFIYTINKYVNNYKILSLILSFHSIYLVYYMSAIRQGLVLAIFFTVLLDLFMNKKYIAYIFGVTICSFIHTSALALLIILIIPKLNKKIIFYLFSGGILISSFVIFSNGLINIINTVFLQFLERLVMLAIITYLYHKATSIDRVTKNFYYIYMIGFILYLVLIGNHLLSARGTMYFKAIEILIIPKLLTKNNVSIDRLIVYFGMCVMIFFLTAKNINAFLDEGNYYSKEIVNYHYVTIFNSDDIYKYRQIRYDIKDLY